MSSARDTQEKPSFIVRLANFLQNNRKVFLYALVGIAIVLVGITVFVLVRQSVVENSTRMVEAAQSQYDTWQGAEEEKKAELETALREQLDVIIKKYPDLYAAQRALFIRASLEAAKENWEPAASDFSALAKDFPKSYLAPLSWFNAGVSYENMGKTDEAITAYKAVVDSYGKASPQAAHALFSLGRLSELKGDSKAAADYYTKLSNDYPDTNWNSLGSNRLIYLASKGEIVR